MSVRLVPDATDEQAMMLDATVRLLESSQPLPAVRALAEGGGTPDPAVRRKLADLGCFGFLVSEDRGGGTLSGNGVLDAAMVAAERGARLQPGPFVATAIVTHALSERGTSPLHGTALDALVAGEASAAWAGDGVFGGGRSPGLTVHERRDGLVLSGVVRDVQDAEGAEWLLVTTGAEAPRQFLVARSTDGLSLRPAESLDVTRWTGELHLADVRIAAGDELGTAGDRRAVVDHQIALAAVLSAAESVGAMHADFELALEYSRTRVAFGRPIGSFQGLKHLLADTSLWLEMSKALVAGAAGALGRGDVDGAALAGMARSFVSERAIDLTHNCFQVFGGIGFTWEHDHHLFMRRLVSEAYAYGDPSWHRERLWQQAADAKGRAGGNERA